MSWEAPLALGLGLAVPAVLLLWMLRPRRPRLRVPSLFLWPGSPAERQSARPWQRLKHHPLLWLQLAIAALLALAAARPFLPAEAAGQHLVVFLDASGSMRARDVAPDRFGVAVGSVLDLARGLGPQQELTVIRLDEQPRVLVAGARGVSQVEAALAGEAASFGPANVAQALALAAGLATGPAEWVLVSDGGLSLPEDARRPAGTSFRFVSVGESGDNVAVTGLSARQSADSVTLQAGLRNTGSSAISGRLQLLADGQLVSVQEWQLPAGGETFVTWSHLPPVSRWFEARLAGASSAINALEHDDRAWVALAESARPRVLLVSAGSAFLERALSIHGGIEAFRAAPADWPGLAAQGAAYPLVVLDRLWPEDPPGGSALLVGPPAGEEFQPGQVSLRSDHPLLRHVDWSEVHVATARRVPLDAAWETVIDSEGGPLLAVREAGSRRLAVLTFDLAQSDLPLRPAFPVLMANLLDWLAPSADQAPTDVPPGTVLAVEPAPLAEQVWVEAENGQRFDLAPPWPPRSFDPPAPGLYQLVQAGEGFRHQAPVVAGGFHPQEVDLAPRALDLPAADGAASAPARGALSFWPWLALAILLISLAEWWLDARGR